MNIKIEAANKWLCLIVNESGSQQGLVEQLKQPIDISSARFVQLNQNLSGVDMYIGEGSIYLRTYNWPKAEEPTEVSGLVSKLKSGLKDIQSKSRGIHKFSIKGSPALIQFGNPTSTDYLKIITDKT